MNLKQKVAKFRKMKLIFVFVFDEVDHRFDWIRIMSDVCWRCIDACVGSFDTAANVADRIRSTWTEWSNVVLQTVRAVSTANGRRDELRRKVNAIGWLRLTPLACVDPSECRSQCSVWTGTDCCADFVIRLDSVVCMARRSLANYRKCSATNSKRTKYDCTNLDLKNGKCQTKEKKKRRRMNKRRNRKITANDM